MFRGSRDPGSAFLWESRQGSFQVVEGLHVPHLSPGMLRSILLEFAHSGSIAARYVCIFSFELGPSQVPILLLMIPVFYFTASDTGVLLYY